MNNDLISRSALLTDIMMLPHNGDIISSDEVEQAIADAPTVDAEPVRYGKWQKMGYACGDTEYECSECCGTEWRTSISRFKYCPFCGARMDAEVNDHGSDSTEHAH